MGCSRSRSATLAGTPARSLLITESASSRRSGRTARRSASSCHQQVGISCFVLRAGRVAGLMDRLAVMQPANRAAFEGVVLRIVSTCILAQRFGLAA